MSSSNLQPENVENHTAAVATVFAQKLREMGVSQAYGVMGGAIAPFMKAVFDSEIQIVHCRHEAGAAFSAIEASLASRKPVVVFVTSGPGLANALNGIVAARWEGAHVIFVSSSSSPAHHGRVATQETTPDTMFGAGVFATGGALHLAATIDHPQKLAPTLVKIAAGLRRKSGFVAHVSLPISSLAAPCAPPALPAVTAAQRDVTRASEHASLLASGSFVLWVGFGARHASDLVRRLAEQTGAPVMCSPRAKGIFSEKSPQFIGVTGLGGHDTVDRYFAENRPDYVLVLGTRMGESTSFWRSEIAPKKAFLHVDVDETAFGAAYPSVPTVGIVADVSEYLQSLLELLPRERVERPVPVTPAKSALTPRDASLVRPQFLMQELQAVFVDKTDAWVMAESGNSFCWANHYLQFTEPGRYRVSTSYGSMGHATSAVVGASLTRKSKAVAIVGDGAMMMMNELHTAVQYRADAVWVVLNDSCYLMCAQGMQVMGWQPFLCELPHVDFVALAKAVGAQGMRVEREADLREALECALHARGPFVLDVSTDRTDSPPSGRRNQSLMQQGFTPAAKR